MTTRSEQKLRTRRAILDAALELLSPEQSFSSLSLREVTRSAGIAPTSFYRHFDDMNDLGLALVEEAGLALRQMLRKARARLTQQGTGIETSVDTFMEYLSNHTDHFRLLLREHTGNSAEFRTAINLEIKHFVTELEEFLRQRSSELGRQEYEYYELAEAMITLVFHMGAQALDASTKQKKELAERTKRQLNMLFNGALLLAKQT